MPPFNGFLPAELEAIGRFVDSLSDSDNYDESVRGIPPEDHELAKLVVKLLSDAECFKAFKLEIAQRVGDSDFEVDSPTDNTRQALKLPEGTLLLSIFPRSGFTDVDTTVAQVRKRWKQVCLFVIDKHGIGRYNLTTACLDALAPPTS